MEFEKRLGIDPVDLESLDTSSVIWNTKTQAWETADGSAVSCHMYGPPVSQIPLGKRIDWDSPTDTSCVLVSYLYDPQLDYKYNKDIYMASLYYLGFTDSEIGSLTIDDVVKKIRETYKYSPDNKDTASMTYIKRKNIALTRQIRRAYHKMQVLNGR